jgi:hypothetical protein
MKKMQEKNKIYNIQDKAPTLLINQAIWMAKTNSPPQISKTRSIEGFGEDINQLSLGVYVSHLNVSLFYMISQEVVSSLNMSHLFMKDWIFSYRDCTGIIVHEENSLKPHSKVSHGVHYPKNLRAAATY